MKPILLKIIRRALYGLAIPTGVAGLFIGGVPVVKYVVELMRDYENRYFYDTQYLNEPVIVFLLSLILLTGVRICFALDKGSQIADPPDSVPSGKNRRHPRRQTKSPHQPSLERRPRRRWKPPMKS